jgi:hypothetical protein
MGLGEKLQVWSFVATVIGSIIALAGVVLGFVGSKLTDRAYWETIRGVSAEITQARSRQRPQWTPFTRVQSTGMPSGLAPFRVQLQFMLHSDDNTVPLMVRVAADAQGSFQSTAAGPAAVVEQWITEDQTYYVSVSHPSITWSAGVLGWTDRRGRDQ